jgi:hypothetical protein
MNAHGPVRGIVSAVAGTATVLWDDGNQVASIVLVTLDLILTSGSETERTRLMGRRVQINDPADQTNWGRATCVDVYARQVNAEGALTIIALLRLEGGGFAEVVSSTCDVVT